MDICPIIAPLLGLLPLGVARWAFFISKSSIFAIISPFVQQTDDVLLIFQNAAKDYESHTAKELDKPWNAYICVMPKPQEG